MQLDFALNLLNSIPLNILVLMLVIPLGGAVLAYLLGNKGARAITLVITTIELGLSLLLILGTPSVGADPGGMSHTWSYVLARLGTTTDSPVFQI
ncbi:MAG: hypothetical protein OEV85_14565, partial [Candidatus Thorarchaeota archaeon]|nr:hypothetical protein [Candidatus Thorarchaeota archaeon]